jgi:hypothetical protein
MKPPTAYSAFISYASANHEKAEKICASLEQRGLVCWMAPRDIRAGREYGDEIILGLERSAAVVLVLSAAANTSVFVLREIERAVSKEINVIPVRIEEVTPSPGLELFISGTHWLDVFHGDWDEHMDRLVRDLADTPIGPAAPDASVGHRSVSPPRSLRQVYVAAALVVVAAVSGIAFWSSRDTTSQTGTSRGSAAPAPAQNPPSAIAPGPSAPVVADPDPTPPAVPVPSARRPEQVQRVVVPATRSTTPPSVADPSPRDAEALKALSAVRSDYDEVSLRGGVIDDALNQLWEEMKPNSPRLDMVTHQRRLRANLTRSKDALAEKDAAGARRYLDAARDDLAALEQFLNR